jgi:thiol-disulfide isomerase/thioredoxin
MAALRCLRSSLLVALSTVLLGFTATASAGSGVQGLGSSTTPSLGEALKASTPEQKALSAHLRAKGAIFYGAWWCPACFQQKNLFGKEGGNTLPYVECDKSDDGRARCVAANVRVFPTWDLAGKDRREGVQTLEELKIWSGFPSAPKQP